MIVTLLPPGQYSRSIVVRGNSDYITIANNRFFNYGTGSSNNESIYFVNESENDADYALIQFNQFFGGSYHVQINSTNYNNNFSNWTIQANVHTNGYQGISLTRASNLLIYGNTMTEVNQGIALASCTGSLQVHRNRLNSWAYGLYFNSCDFSMSTTPNVYNNIIRCSGYNWYGGYGSVNARGLSVSSCEDIYAAHNSIELNSPASGSIASVISGTKNIFRKNQIVNLGGGYAINFVNTEPGVSNRNLVEFNNIYARGAYLGRHSNTYYTEMDDMIALFGEYNADYNPFYEDAYLRTHAPRLDNLGDYFGIDVDFFDNPRNPVTPDIGAHEYTVDHLDPLTAPMAGTYYIGAGGDYTSLNTFAQDLSLRGVNDPITAYLTDATYNEQVSFDRIPGIGWDRLLTVRRFDNPEATITYSAQDAESNFVVQLFRSQYIKFQNISFATQATDYSNILVFNGFAKEIEFINCDFIAPTGIADDATSNSIFSDSNSNLNNIRIFGGSFEGNGTGVAVYAANLELSYNTFTSCGRGIQLNQAVAPLIEGNSFSNCNSWAFITNGISDGTIIKNRVRGARGGINVSNATLGEDRTLVANNVILLEGSGAGSGLWVGGTGLNVLNNSVYISGNVNGSALYLSSQPSETDIVNNIFVSMDGYAMELSSYSPNPGFVLDYNCYYTQSNYLLRMQSYFTDLPSLQNTYPQVNSHSVRYNPLFSESMQARSQYTRGLGLARTEINDDINGIPRGENWDLGAHQQILPNDLDPLAGTYTVGGPGFDFESLEEALQAVQYHGIDGHVTLNLQPGTYSGGYIIEDFPRAFPSQHLIISGLETSHTFTLDAQSNIAAENFFFQIRAASGVILSTMHLMSSPTNLPVHYIRTKGRVNDINIRHITFDIPNTTSTAINTGTSLGDDILVEQCTFNGGGYGVYLAAHPNDNNLFGSPRIYLNTFNNVQYPVTVYKARDLDLSYNSMSSFSKAIYLSSISGASKIFKNRMITANPGSSGTLLSFNHMHGTADEYIDIYQNIAYLQNHGSYATVLDIWSSSYLNLQHNTFVAENNYFFDYGTALNASSSSNMILKNNVFSAPHRGYAISLSSATELEWMANAYYGAAKYLGRVNGMDYAPLELYSAILTDPLASFANPLTDIQGYNTSSYLRDRGVATSILTDIDGETWTGQPSPGANDIAGSGAMFTTAQTIGSTGDFPDLPTALDALQNRGIDADICFYLQSGTYPTHYDFGYIPGTIEGRNFTLTAAPGAEPILSYSATTTADNYILNLKNLYNTTIDGLSFLTQGAQYGTAIKLASFNNDLLIRNNHFTTSTPGATSSNFCGINGYDSANVSLRIEDNQMQDMAFGVYFYNDTNHMNYEIKGNRLSNAYIGLYLSSLGGAEIWNNEIDARYQALYLRNVIQADVRANKLTTTGGSYVLNHSIGQATTTSQKIYNNYICGNADQAALYLSVANAQVYHNTIVNTNSSASSRAFKQASQSSGLDFKNNICQAGPGLAANFYSTAHISAIAANIYNSTTGTPVMLGSTPLADIAAYQSTMGDLSSLYTGPMLVPESYLLTASSPAINAGVSLGEVPFDIDGNLRELPDMGCSEFSVLALDAPQNLQLLWQEDVLTLSWDAVPLATGYLISVSETPEFGSYTQHESPINTFSLSPVGSRLFFRVVAVRD